MLKNRQDKLLRNIHKIIELIIHHLTEYNNYASTLN